MKIEIDTDDPKKLRQLEAELSKALSIVRFALNGQIQQRGGHQGDSENGDNETDRILEEVVASLPAHFTSSNVRDSVAGRLTRAAVNSGLSRLAQRKAIKTIQPGLGRRPATFEKTT